MHELTQRFHSHNVVAEFVLSFPRTARTMYSRQRGAQVASPEAAEAAAEVAARDILASQPAEDDPRLVLGSQATELPDSAFPEIPDRPGPVSQPIEFDLNEQPDG